MADSTAPISAVNPELGRLINRAKTVLEMIGGADSKASLRGDKARTFDEKRDTIAIDLTSLEAVSPWEARWGCALRLLRRWQAFPRHGTARPVTTPQTSPLGGYVHSASLVALSLAGLCRPASPRRAGLRPMELVVASARPGLRRFWTFVTTASGAAWTRSGSTSRSATGLWTSPRPSGTWYRPCPRRRQSARFVPALHSRACPLPYWPTRCYELLQYPCIAVLQGSCLSLRDRQCWLNHTPFVCPRPQSDVTAEVIAERREAVQELLERQRIIKARYMGRSPDEDSRKRLPGAIELSSLGPGAASAAGAGRGAGAGGASAAGGGGGFGGGGGPVEEEEDITEEQRLAMAQNEEVDKAIDSKLGEMESILDDILHANRGLKEALVEGDARIKDVTEHIGKTKDKLDRVTANIKRVLEVSDSRSSRCCTYLICLVVLLGIATVIFNVVSGSS